MKSRPAGLSVRCIKNTASVIILFSSGLSKKNTAFLQEIIRQYISMIRTIRTEDSKNIFLLFYHFRLFCFVIFGIFVL